MAMQGAPDTATHREILPDGTVHQKINLTRTQDKNVAETIETFERPPKLDQDMEEIEDIMPDGTKVIRQVAMNRIVHSIKTRHESFDESTGRVVKDYEVEEVIPNTASAFDAGLDSDYEDEIREKKARSLSVDMDMEEIEEVQPDGTKIKRQVTMNRVVHMSRDPTESFDPRKGQVQKDYPITEVVPGTASAFVSGQDSD